MDKLYSLLSAAQRNYPHEEKAMFEARFSRDINGNTIVKIIKKGYRGFSIQTNGNLPETHRTKIPNHGEILQHVIKFGTDRQKQIVNA